MTSGLIAAGLSLVAGFDQDQFAIENYNLNFPGRGVVADVSRLKLKAGCADVLVGGLPCQSFSTLGRMDPDDPRNELWHSFINVVADVMPIAWCVENVARFARTRQCGALMVEATKLGYRVSSQIVEAVSFGVPQRRRRAVIIAGLNVKPATIVGDAEAKNVRWAFRDLPIEPNGRNLHTPRKPKPLSLARYAMVPSGGSRKDLPSDLQNPCWLRLGDAHATNVFGRLSWDRPSDTIRTTFLKPETGRYIHPEANRGLTLREGMRLQGFSDSFKLVGGMHQCAVLVGNAVPPPIGEVIGRELARIVAVGRRSGRSSRVLQTT